MPSYKWNGYEKVYSPFAINYDIPLYISKDGSKDFNKKLMDYILECETIVKKEKLVSEVQKSSQDPYPYTQQWKQHNLVDDAVYRLNGENLIKFKSNPIQQELLEKIRENYLVFLAESKNKRVKCWIHVWANVLREGEFISPHSHISSEHSHLACVYYPHNSNTELFLHHPYVKDLAYPIKTEESKIIFFPSWMNHVSSKTDGLRISIAADIVLEDTVKGNPWRPHIIFDDPLTMKGLE